MNSQQTLKKLKKFNLETCDVSLAIIKEYKKQRVSRYNASYVPVNEPIEVKLRRIMSSHIGNANSVEEYSADCPEPEGGEVRAIDYKKTDFIKIMEKLIPLNPEEDVVTDVNDLVKAKSYVIVLHQDGDIKAIGFRILPENWKMKNAKGFISLMYKNKRFEDLDSNPVFSIANSIDFVFYEEKLFILSKKSFEAGLNFREGMINKANEFYGEADKVKIFFNIELLKNKVGNNQRYLRKISTIQNLGYYKNKKFLNRMKGLSEEKEWDIQFDKGQIMITEENLDHVLSILQNKRLYSEFTEEDFDVDSVKPI